MESHVPKDTIVQELHIILLRVLSEHMLSKLVLNPKILVSSAPMASTMTYQEQLVASLVAQHPRVLEVLHRAFATVKIVILSKLVVNACAQLAINLKMVHLMSTVTSIVNLFQKLHVLLIKM
jgi:hypothetical protein